MYSEVRVIVRMHGGHVTHWRLLPALNLTGRADIQLRGDSQLIGLRGRSRLKLYNTRQTLRFILTRLIRDVDVPRIASSLADVYAEQMPSDDYPRELTDDTGAGKLVRKKLGLGLKLKKIHKFKFKFLNAFKKDFVVKFVICTN